MAALPSAPAAAPAAPRDQSIGSQLRALMFFAMLPLAALVAWSLYSAARDDERQARDQVMHLALMVASDTARFLGQAHNILNGLAARPAVRALDPARCDPILKDFLALAPRFANVATMRLDGEVVCSGAPIVRPVRMDPEKFLKRLRGPGELTVGEITPGTITGRWAIPVGLPLSDAQGGTTGAVGLAIDLQLLAVQFGIEGLSANTVVGIVAADGTVLARSAEPERFVGTNNRDRPETRRMLAEKRGTAEERGLDGVRRIRGYVPIPGTDWIAVASVPASEVYAPVRRRAVASALVACAIVALALLLALRWMRKIERPLADLGGAARRVAAGDLGARAHAEGAREVVEVADQFNRMLDARSRAEAALSESEERLRRILDNMFPFVGLFSLDGRVLEANRAPLEAANLARAEVIGKPFAETYWWSYSPEVQARLRAALERAAAGEMVRYDETIRIRDGRFMDIDLMFSPLRDGAGRIEAIVGSATDITERRAYTEELRRLSRRILETADGERLAISRELHDRIGQNLATLNLNLEFARSRMASHAPADALGRIDDARALLESTARHARDLMAELDPPGLKDYGLLAALRTHAESFAGRVGLPVAVAGADCEPRLEPRVEMALFRIAQEALANAAKHAHAGRVEVTLAPLPDRVTLTIADDGRGFDPRSARESASWGLTIMRERAGAAGAGLRIESWPGRGTRVVAEVARAAA